MERRPTRELPPGYSHPMFHSPSLKPWLAGMALALLPVLSPAQTNVTVNANQPVRTVTNRMFGINAVMWDPDLATTQTIDLVNAAGLRFIRIPGGSVSDEYHWNINRSLSNTWSWASGMDAFTTLIAGANAQVTAVANYGTGTPEEAAAWVAYANAPANLQGTPADVVIGTDANGMDWKTAGYWSALRASAKLATDDGSNFLRQGRTAPIGIKYWEIGNEIYGNWETDHNAVPHDPYTYAVRAKVYIAKMKAVDPSIKIGVVATVGEDSYANNTSHPATNPRTGVTHNGWTPVMLSTLKTLGVTPDFLIYHRYDQQPGQETDAGLLSSPHTWLQDAASLRQQLSDYLGAAGAGVALIATENNSVSSLPGKQSTSIVNGLFYADTLGNVLQTEFRGYMWWALRNGPPTSNGAITGNMSSSLYGWRNYGDYGILSTPVTGGDTTYYDAYPVYYMMKLVSHFARGDDTVVAASSDNPLLDAFAVRGTDGRLRLLLINKSPTADTTANITLTGFTPSANATEYSYGVQQDDAARTGTGTNDVATSSLPNAGATFSLTVPHYTAAVVALSLAKPLIVLQPVGGSVGSGANVTLSVEAEGTGTVTYQWRKDGTAIAGATSATLSLSGVTPADSGSYTVVVNDDTGVAVTSQAAGLSVSGSAYVPPASTLINISTRTEVGTGGNVMIAGFTIAGTGSKKVLIRAVGPGLVPYQVNGVLVDPQLVVTKSDGTFIAWDDDWGTGDTAAITAAGNSVGAFPLAAGSRDAALILTLPAGAYTAIVQGAVGGTGIGLAEVYDLDGSSATRLINLSTRAEVGTGAQAMIGGFAVRGTAPRKVLIRAVGPGLAQWIGGTLPDPMLAIINPTTKATVATNDDWGTPDGSAITAADAATGAFPLAVGSKDAAILTSLPSGGYTPQVTDKNDASGVALFELYEAP